MRTNDTSLNSGDCVGHWLSWGSCSATCGDAGARTRTFVVSENAREDGAPCAADAADVEAQACNTQECPVDCDGSWGNWGECSSSSEGEMRFRTFKIATEAAAGGVACALSNNATQSCDCSGADDDCGSNECAGAWSSWSSCAATCGSYAVRFRTFILFASTQHDSTLDCENTDETEFQHCYDLECSDSAVESTNDVTTAPDTSSALPVMVGVIVGAVVTGALVGLALFLRHRRQRAAQGTRRRPSNEKLVANFRRKVSFRTSHSRLPIGPRDSVQHKSLSRTSTQSMGSTGSMEAVVVVNIDDIENGDLFVHDEVEDSDSIADTESFDGPTPTSSTVRQALDELDVELTLQKDPNLITMSEMIATTSIQEDSDIRALILPQSALGVDSQTPIVASGGAGRIYKCRLKRDIALNGPLHEGDTHHNSCDTTAATVNVPAGTVVALKETFAVMMTADVSAFAKELMFQSTLHHRHIVPFYGIYVCPGGGHTRNGRIASSRYFLVSRFAKGGNLRAALRRPYEEVSFDVRVQWLREIAGAIEYMHSRQVVHRDIKPENILLDASGKCQITDFGIARAMSSSRTLTRQIGTIAYMPPEAMDFGTSEQCSIDQLANSSADDTVPSTEQTFENMSQMMKFVPAWDAYSFGILAATIFNCEEPYADMNLNQIVVGVVARNLRPQLPVNVSTRGHLFLRRLWHQDPIRRPSFVEIVAALQEGNSPACNLSEGSEREQGCVLEAVESSSPSRTPSPRIRRPATADGFRISSITRPRSFSE